MCSKEQKIEEHEKKLEICKKNIQRNKILIFKDICEDNLPESMGLLIHHIKKYMLFNQKS